MPHKMHPLYRPEFQTIETPFYYYDMELLGHTLDTCRTLLDRYGYKAHYALKANSERRILETVCKSGLGADCVSGNEVLAAVDAGFDPSTIVFAGVGKTDREIRNALGFGIFSFNCESVPEIEVIDSLAGAMGRKARISLRVNPDVDAHTNSHITTGRKENKFGILPSMFSEVMEVIGRCRNVELIGLHFHIGSQILDMECIAALCHRVDEIQRWFVERGFRISVVNLGGGLGVDYDAPDRHPVADFEAWFSTVAAHLHPLEGQEVHFEPGRSIVAQCGTLISRVTYVKEGEKKRFIILDAGMNDLIRPALYDAHHAVENITSEGRLLRYDVVGPVCESSDTFAKNILVAKTGRGDLVALRTAGAYGQAMAMRYNLRDLAKAYYSDNL